MYFNWTDPNKMRNILSRHQTHPHHFHRAASLREAQGPPPRIANQSPAYVWRVQDRYTLCTCYCQNEPVF